MAVKIIDRLEPIEVDQHHGAGEAGAGAGHIEGAFEARGEEAPVGQARERIVARQGFGAFLRLAECDRIAPEHFEGGGHGPDLVAPVALGNPDAPVSIREPRQRPGDGAERTRDMEFGIDQEPYRQKAGSDRQGDHKHGRARRRLVGGRDLDVRGRPSILDQVVRGQLHGLVALLERAAIAHGPGHLLAARLVDPGLVVCHHLAPGRLEAADVLDHVDFPGHALEPGQ